MKLVINTIFLLNLFLFSSIIEAQYIEEVVDFNNGNKIQKIFDKDSNYYLKDETLKSLLGKNFENAKINFPQLFIITQAKKMNSFWYSIYERRYAIKNIINNVDPINYLNINDLFYFMKHPYETNKLEYIGDYNDAQNNEQNTIFPYLDNYIQEDKEKYALNLINIGLFYAFLNKNNSQNLENIKNNENLAIAKNYFNLFHEKLIDNVIGEYCFDYFSQNNENDIINQEKLAEIANKIENLKRFILVAQKNDACQIMKTEKNTENTNKFNILIKFYILMKKDLATKLFNFIKTNEIDLETLKKYIILLGSNIRDKDENNLLHALAQSEHHNKNLFLKTLYSNNFRNMIDQNNNFGWSPLNILTFKGKIKDYFYNPTRMEEFDYITETPFQHQFNMPSNTRKDNKNQLSETSKEVLKIIGDFSSEGCLEDGKFDKETKNKLKNLLNLRQINKKLKESIDNLYSEKIKKNKSNTKLLAIANDPDYVWDCDEEEECKKVLKKIQKLVKAGANPNIKNDDEGLPILYIISGWAGCYYNSDASRNLLKETISLLIKNGADLNFKSYNGETALITSIRNACPEISILLIESKTDINISDDNGVTPIMHCLIDSIDNEQFLNLAMLENVPLELVKRGANLQIKNNDKKTVFDYIEELEKIKNSDLIAKDDEENLDSFLNITKLIEEKNNNLNKRSKVENISDMIEKFSLNTDSNIENKKRKTSTIEENPIKKRFFSDESLRKNLFEEFN